MSELNLPKLKTINCHAGKLPFYRGRNILNWALINDEKKFGITVHYVDEKIDCGDIILQRIFKITDKDNILDLSYHIAKALQYPFNDKHHAIKITGCGMDMAFHVVHNLSHALYGTGYKLKSKII